MSQIYVSDCDLGRVLVLELDTDSGALAIRQEIKVDGKIMPLAVSPDRRALYGAIRSQPYRFAHFAIDQSDGALRLVDYAEARDSVVYLSIDPSGRWLLSACNPPRGGRRTGILTVNPIGPGGEVGPVETVLRTPSKLHCVLPDLAGRFAMTAICDSDLVQRYTFDDRTGRISQDGLAPVILLPKAGPRHLRFGPDGRFLYVLNEYDGSIYAYRYGAETGSLSELQIVSAVPPGFEGLNVEAAELQFTPDGQLAFASVRESRTLAAFTVDADAGQLSLTGHYGTADTPRSFAIDPSGRWLVAGGQFDGELAVHRIEEHNGALTRTGGLVVGGSPIWLTFCG
jgi:6-phosphogluconolactonase